MFLKVTVKEIKEFIYENHLNQIVFTKSECNYSLKRLEKLFSKIK